MYVPLGGHVSSFLGFDLIFFLEKVSNHLFLTDSHIMTDNDDNDGGGTLGRLPSAISYDKFGRFGYLQHFLIVFCFVSCFWFSILCFSFCCIFFG